MKESKQWQGGKEEGRASTHSAFIFRISRGGGNVQDTIYGQTYSSILFIFLWSIGIAIDVCLMKGVGKPDA